MMELSQTFGVVPKWQPKSKKPGQLTKEQVQQYYTDGYVIVEDYFTEEELLPVKQNFEEIVDELAKCLYKAGKIKELYNDYDFFQRLTKIEDDFPGANLLPHKLGYLPQGMKDVFQNDRMLNGMEQILGTEDIMANPIYCIRYKTPHSEAAEVPWHQDAAYFDDEACKIMHATAWIPLLDTNHENGAIQVVRGGSKSGRLVPHTGCWRDTFYIECSGEEMENTLGVSMDRDTVVCNVPYKGVLFYNNMLPFRCLPNISNKIRWSFEMRYQKKGLPYGFYDLIDGIPLRSSTNPNLKPDWSKMPHENDIKVAMDKSTMGGTHFITIHHGPWLGKWPIVHTNKHTDAYYDSLKKSGGKAVSWHAAQQANEVAHTT